MDIELHYERRGSGPPLILLHGNGEDGSYFSHQMEDFSREYTVYAVDTRGHGRSPRGTAPFTLSRFAEDLRVFLDARGIPKADILGFSDGGNIALLFALRWPERVGRLILNGANLDPSGVRRGAQLPIELGWRFCRRFRSPAARAHAELLGLMVTQPHIDPRELSKLPMPVLVIAGTRDVIREDHTRLIAASIPAGRLALLPGGHFIANRSPDAFDRAVREFLRETAVSGEEG